MVFVQRKVLKEEDMAEQVKESIQLFTMPIQYLNGMLLKYSYICLGIAYQLIKHIEMARQELVA